MSLSWHRYGVHTKCRWRNNCRGDVAGDAAGRSVAFSCGPGHGRGWGLCRYPSDGTGMKKLPTSNLTAESRTDRPASAAERTRKGRGNAYMDATGERRHGLRNNTTARRDGRPRRDSLLLLLSIVRRPPRPPGITATPGRRSGVSTCTGLAAACSGARCAWATTRAA